MLGAQQEVAFDQVFKEGGVPDDIGEHRLPDQDPVQLPGLIRDAFGTSGSEARRLLTQGAVSLDGMSVLDSEVSRSELDGRVLRVGKRRFVRLID